MDSPDIKSAVHGRTRAILPHTEGGKPKAKTLRGLYKHVCFTVNYANTCSSDATIYLINEMRLSKCNCMNYVTQSDRANNTRPNLMVRLTDPILSFNSNIWPIAAM